MKKGRRESVCVALSVQVVWLVCCVCVYTCMCVCVSLVRKVWSPLSSLGYRGCILLPVRHHELLEMYIYVCRCVCGCVCMCVCVYVYVYVCVYVCIYVYVYV